MPQLANETYAHILVIKSTIWFQLWWITSCLCKSHFPKSVISGDLDISRALERGGQCRDQIFYSAEC